MFDGFRDSRLVLRGAYHPALGELVRSRVLLEMARVLLRDTEPGSAVTLGVPTGKASQMAGQKRGNLRVLTEEFSFSGLKIREIPGQTEEIRVLSVEKN